jgi:VIT1/CCC1 family predicted Fe2+/Mn2+ transporter
MEVISSNPKRSFFATYLAPVDSLSEIIFGLIMVLGFTSTARLVFGETSGKRLLLAVIGCNLAWGIVDAVMYILDSLYERGQRARIVDAVRGAPNDSAALAIVAQELEEPLAVLDDDQRAQIYRWALAKARSSAPKRVRITKDDIYGAIASGLLVFLAVLPVAIPFVVVSDTQLALRLSNLTSVALLFVVGYHWARQTRMNQVVAGLLLMILGLALVAVTIALGG